MGITAIIHTKNEERNIRRSISSVSEFVDEILVVDMSSTDRTVEIATGLGAKVLEVDDVGYVEPARQFAIEQAQNEWILVCDADEIVLPRLASRLRRIAEYDEADVVTVAFDTYMFGQALVGSGWSSKVEKHQRFFKRGALQFSTAIHSTPILRDGARVLDLSGVNDCRMVHFNYSDFEHFVLKLNRYTTVEAAKNQVISVPRLVFRIAYEVFQRLIMERAWRDGYRGLVLIQLMITYRLLSYAKARLNSEFPSEEDIFREYDAIAARYLSGARDQGKGLESDST